MKSVYIHIPFCTNICSYCDFPKMYKIEEYVEKYLNALEQEIKNNYNNESIETIYIGGGTPSCLNLNNLKKLFEIINIFKFDKNVEFTFECNICDINENLLSILKENKVNRISIGVQTFNSKFIKYLNRKHTKEEVLNKMSLIKNYFQNINIDLMYAIKEETLEDLKEDLNLFLSLGVPHISTYSLIIEPHTVLYKNNEEYIDEELDYEMYNLIEKNLKENGYNHYEVSNYSKEGFESKHNLTYWNNENYYGFGLGASGYIKNIRYTNTKNLLEYIEGNYKYIEDELSENEQMQEEMFLGLRKMKGVSKEKFYQKYGKNIEDVFDIKNLIESSKLIEKDGYIYINSDYIYVSNDILINFVG